MVNISGHGSISTANAFGRSHAAANAALTRILLHPTETHAGDPEHCRIMEGSSDDPGVSNAWDSTGAREAPGSGHSRCA